MLVSATAMLQSAQKGHYGLGAFNTNNLEWATSIYYEIGRASCRERV